MPGLAALDWLVMAAYAAVVLCIGWWANRRQTDTEQYFLGGRRLRWWLVGVSLVATSFSSISLIGGTGFGFSTGLQWLQLQLGDLLALVAVCLLFLPFFSSLGLTTAYGYLERRFGGRARLVASGLFLGQTLLRTSILVYSPALALSAILGWPVETAIVVTAAAAVIYSACGGIAAVVWTDLIQLAVIVFAVTYSLTLVTGDIPGGFDAILGHAHGSGRLEVVTMEADVASPFNLLGALVPYAVLAFSLFGTGQQAVQRFLACRDLRAARRAALTGWAIGTTTLAITLFLGVCLAAWVELAPAGAALGPVQPDEVLPRFLATRLPAGLAGLMLAAIFAASMSSMDSAIHSMSTALIVDFHRRFARRPSDTRRELRIARLCTVLFGVLAIDGALLAARSQTQILETLVTWLGYFAGPLLGLFLLGMLTRRANEAGALAGVTVAFLTVVVAVVAADGRPAGLHPLWLAPGSCMLTLLVGYTVSLDGRPPRPDQLAGLTITSSPSCGAGRSGPGARTASDG